MFYLYAYLFIFIKFLLKSFKNIGKESDKEFKDDRSIYKQTWHRSQLSSPSKQNKRIGQEWK